MSFCICASLFLFNISAKGTEKLNGDNALEAVDDGNVKEVTDDQEELDEEDKPTKKQK